MLQSDGTYDDTCLTYDKCEAELIFRGITPGQVGVPPSSNFPFQDDSYQVKGCYAYVGVPTYDYYCSNQQGWWTRDAPPHCASQPLGQHTK